MVSPLGSSGLAVAFTPVTTDIRFIPQTGLNRRGGGVLGLAYPLALIGLALSVDFRGTSHADDLATAILGALLFLVAAPTAWVFAIDFIEASPLTVISVGTVTSLPLWYFLGSRLAMATTSWRRWTWRYASVCGLWTLLVFVLMFVLAAVAG
jgi:hypothetical protein